VRTLHNCEVTADSMSFFIRLQAPAFRRSQFLYDNGLRISIISFLVVVCCTTAWGQTSQNLAKVNKVYVEDFGQEASAKALREKFISDLELKGKFEVVTAADQADALIRGEGSVWLTGYLSTDPHTATSMRQPVYRGFLSIEVLGKDRQPLWSYLVTPRKFRSADIASDLADQLVAKLLTAMKKNEELAAAPIANSTVNVTLAAAGATFPAPLYQRWFESFEEGHAGVNIKYNAVGSGAGIKLLLDGRLDFAASDIPLTDERMSQENKAFLHFASVIGAVVPAYNLKGMNGTLKFTPSILAGIYLGKIHRWNDAAIREVNRGADLPDAEIAVIHRTDASGTTFVWTDYLSKLSPEWKSTVGSGAVVQWPLGTGEEGNEAVAAAVQSTPNSFGYIELVYALRHELSFGAVRNSAGRFVQADLPSVTEAGESVAASVHTDSRVSITNASGRGAYPIASFTWWLVPKDLPIEPKKSALLELLQWMLTSGQKECSALGYVPLPHEIAEGELEILQSLK
jgi:phosphate transport system substrate-binding protein